MSKATELSEVQVRALRDRVYGKPTSDKNWDGCKDKWMEPENIAWLQSQNPDKPL